MSESNPFKGFHSSPDVIRLAVMMYLRFPLSLRNVEDLLHERGIDVSHETIRFWWQRFGPMFASEIKRKRVDRRSTASSATSGALRIVQPPLYGPFLIRVSGTCGFMFSA